MRRMAGRGFLAAALCFMLAGCASFMPDVQPAARGAPPGAPVTTGGETPASAEHKRLVGMFGGEYRAPAAETHLNGILARLAQADDTPGRAYRVTILNTPAVNAFALPSGNLYVTRGLLALANDSSEVAAVMAHEIAHVTARHASQREEAALTADLRRRAASAVQSRERGEEVQAIEKLSLASFSRRQELEADQIGVSTIARAGLDPYGAARFLEALGKSTAMRASLLGGKGGEDPDIMSTHPSTPERINRAIAAARQIGAPGVGAAGRDEYLNAVNGIDFGDDPAEGLVRGRRFVHAKLGFSFVAPEGFSLENSQQAVLGVAAGGAEALRLDSVQAPAETPLDTYMRTGWVEGLEQDSVKATTVNGLPAALATAAGPEWKFRVAAIRLGPEVYRVIFASRSLTAETDKRYLAAINTFRRIPPAEASSLRPLRLAVVAAAPGDTTQSLSEKMAVADRAQDVFMLINGLRRTGPLEPGRRYKIVRE
ncbi:MAG: peptidase Ste24p [Hyphomicrobiales bacterium]|nr:peptidase Ste24p [Hyphomicrobiales bacterium]